MKYLFTTWVGLVGFISAALTGLLFSGYFDATCVEPYRYVSGCAEYGPGGLSGSAAVGLGLVTMIITIVMFICALTCRDTYTGFIAKLNTSAATIKAHEDAIEGMKANISDIKELHGELMANHDSPIASQMKALSLAQAKLAKEKAKVEDIRAKKIAYELGPFKGFTEKAEHEQHKTS